MGLPEYSCDAPVGWGKERSTTAGSSASIGRDDSSVLYGLMPCLIGWRALARQVTGRTGWAKTARETESEETPEGGSAGEPSAAGSAEGADSGSSVSARSARGSSSV